MYFQRRHHLPHRELRLVALSLSCEAGLALLSLSSTFVSAAVGLVRREFRSSLPVACKGRAWLPRTARSITWLENSRRAALSARSPCVAGQRHADREVRARASCLVGPPSAGNYAARVTPRESRDADDSEPSPPSIHRRSLDLLSIALPVSAGAAPPQSVRALASSSRFTGSHGSCDVPRVVCSRSRVHVFKRRRLDRLNL